MIISEKDCVFVPTLAIQCKMSQEKGMLSFLALIQTSCRVEVLI